MAPDTYFHHHQWCRRPSCHQTYMWGYGPLQNTTRTSCSKKDYLSCEVPKSFFFYYFFQNRSLHGIDHTWHHHLATCLLPFGIFCSHSEMLYTLCEIWSGGLDSLQFTWKMLLHYMLMFFYYSSSTISLFHLSSLLSPLYVCLLLIPSPAVIPFPDVSSLPFPRDSS